MLTRLQPDIVFITGDLYDGGKVDPDQVAAPLKNLSPRFGAYFVTGNHEEFSNSANYLDAISRSGIGVLENEKVVIEGLQIVGVNDRDSTDPHRFRSILERAELDRRSTDLARWRSAIPIGPTSCCST